jgi:hypothetical protein
MGNCLFIVACVKQVRESHSSERPGMSRGGGDGAEKWDEAVVEVAWGEERTVVEMVGCEAKGEVSAGAVAGGEDEEDGSDSGVSDWETGEAEAAAMDGDETEVDPGARGKGCWGGTEGGSEEAEDDEDEDGATVAKADGGEEADVVGT